MGRDVRPVRVRGTRMAMLINRYALVAVIAAFVILAATGNLFAPVPVVIAFQGLAVLVLVSSRRSFPRGAFRVDAAPATDAVIRRGPYRLIRHPMYAAALLFLWSGVLAHRSTLAFVVGILTTMIAGLRIYFEERLLRERYPDYAVYARSTKAVVPFVI
jgi:protein-S-isoprenylcysteine O-methyltransferase Ste14